MQGQGRDEQARSSEQRTDEEVLVSELSTHDVLLGRGTGPNENQGNKILRSLVAQFQEEYDQAQSRKGRHDVAMQTLQEIKKSEGRFLERASLGSSGEDDDGGGAVHYVMVGDKKAICKIKQAFRYNIQTNKHAKRNWGESLHQEEFHDNKRRRLSSSPAAAGGIAGAGSGAGSDGAAAAAAFSGEHHLPAHHRYRTVAPPSTHRLDLGQPFPQHHPFAIGHGLLRDPIITPELARIEQRLGVGIGAAGIGAARSIMAQHHHTSRPPLYGMVQPSAYEQASLAAASRIPLGGMGPFHSSLASTQSFAGALSPLHYPLTITAAAPAPAIPSWLRMPAGLPPTNQQLRLARDLLLQSSVHHPGTAAAHRPFLAGVELVRNEAGRPSEIRSNDDAEDGRGEESRLAKRYAYDSHFPRSF
jgi:hypothetical protein